MCGAWGLFYIFASFLIQQGKAWKVETDATQQMQGCVGIAEGHSVHGVESGEYLEYVVGSFGLYVQWRMQD